MSELERAIKHFLQAEEMINKANQKEKELQQKFDEEKRRTIGGTCSPEDATIIYNANLQILNHKKEVEKQKEKLLESENIIKAHLELLDDVSISYVDSTYKNGMPPYKNYLFFLVDGKVKHNKQPK